MVELTVEGDTLFVAVKGLHKLWALKHRVAVPISSIAAIRADPEAARGWWKGLRLGGTHVPGVFTAGTYYHQDKWVFFDVRSAERAIVIDLIDHRYDQLVVEVEDPAAAISMIEQARAS